MEIVSTILLITLMPLNKTVSAPFTRPARKLLCLNRRVYNYYKILLSTDIERNAAPGIIDPTKAQRK